MSNSIYSLLSACAPIQPEEIPLFRAAERRGSGERAVVCGDSLQELAVQDFVRANSDSTSLLKKYVPGFLSAPLEKFLSMKPAVRTDPCVGCGACARVCPADSVTITAGKARISRKKCIRCFCCQEFCPHKAIAAR